MNRAFGVILSVLMLSEFGAVWPMPSSQETGEQSTDTELSQSQRIRSNYVDENFELETADKVTLSKSKMCAYFQPTDDCHKSKEGCPKFKACGTGHNSACYTLWRGNKILLQGCWFGGNCRHHQCVGKKILTRFTLPVYHCCCFGDNCNADHALPNEIPTKTKI